MATADSVRAKLQGLIAKANEATGNTDVDLTTAVNALVAGFGQGGGGLPEGLLEYEIQTFTPENDTNAELPFSLNMEEAPTHIYITANEPITLHRSFRSYYCHKRGNTDDGMSMGGRVHYWTTNTESAGYVSPGFSESNRSGIMRLTNKGFTFRGIFYGGQFVYFRAGYTYTIIAMRLVTHG